MAKATPDSMIAAFGPHAYWAAVEEIVMFRETGSPDQAAHMARVATELMRRGYHKTPKPDGGVAAVVPVEEG